MHPLPTGRRRRVFGNERVWEYLSARRNQSFSSRAWRSQRSCTHICLGRFVAVRVYGHSATGLCCSATAEWRVVTGFVQPARTMGKGPIAWIWMLMDANPLASCGARNSYLPTSTPIVGINPATPSSLYYISLPLLDLFLFTCQPAKSLT